MNRNGGNWAIALNPNYILVIGKNTRRASSRQIQGEIGFGEYIFKSSDREVEVWYNWIIGVGWWQILKQLGFVVGRVENEDMNLTGNGVIKNAGWLNYTVIMWYIGWMDKIFKNFKWAPSMNDEVWWMKTSHIVLQMKGSAIVRNLSRYITNNGTGLQHEFAPAQK